MGAVNGRGFRVGHGIDQGDRVGEDFVGDGVLEGFDDLRQIRVVSLYLHVDANDRITDIGFEGSGCAISMASASLLTETVSDLCVADADACSNVVTSRLTHKEQDNNDSLQVDLSKLMALDGVRELPSRIKCATLAWHTLNAAMDGDDESVTTE